MQTHLYSIHTRISQHEVPPSPYPSSPRGEGKGTGVDSYQN